MKKNTMNAELNKAIWEVLISKFRKDAKEAFKMVEDAGYAFHKNGDGNWVVFNPKTERTIWRSKYNEIWHAGIRTLATSRTREEFDFVGCLNKPLNREYDPYGYGYYGRPHNGAREKFRNLEAAKNRVEWTNERIEEIQRQMVKLQKELVNQVEYRVKYEAEVNELRKEYGLKTK